MHSVMFKSTKLWTSFLDGPKGTFKTRPPIAWVYPYDDFVFLHELGHLFGCDHDRLNSGHLLKESNCGYLMKGSGVQFNIQFLPAAKRTGL